MTGIVLLAPTKYVFSDACKLFNPKKSQLMLFDTSSMTMFSKRVNALCLAIPNIGEDGEKWASGRTGPPPVSLKMVT